MFSVSRVVLPVCIAAFRYTTYSYTWAPLVVAASPYTTSDYVRGRVTVEDRVV